MNWYSYGTPVSGSGMNHCTTALACMMQIVERWLLRFEYLINRTSEEFWFKLSPCIYSVYVHKEKRTFKNYFRGLFCGIIGKTGACEPTFHI